MYVSQIEFRFEPQRFDHLRTIAAGVVERLRQVPGCRQVVVLRTAPDTLTSYVTYATQVHAEAATPTIAAFFAELAPHLTRLPQRRIYPALYYAQFET
jgi:quinol monooxygenase YgiN